MAFLSDPNVAFVLFVAGLAGILVELVHPTILGGVFGALCLVLAVIGFSGLPLNIAGLLLIAVGMVLFVLESQITSHGVLAAGGLIAFVIGASMLYSPLPGSPSIGVAVPVIVATAGVFAAFMGTVIYAALRIRQMPAGRDGVGTTPTPGVTGTVQAPLAPLGTVHLAGETWTARSVDGRELGRETPVRLVAWDGLTAVVASENAPPGPPLPPASSPAARPNA
ncbi:MAG: NfeD family protein [Chloroflexota bacterium]